MDVADLHACSGERAEILDYYPVLFFVAAWIDPDTLTHKEFRWSLLITRVHKKSLSGIRMVKVALLFERSRELFTFIGQLHERRIHPLLRVAIVPEIHERDFV